jgi:hypothetical protein
MLKSADCPAELATLLERVNALDPRVVDKLDWTSAYHEHSKKISGKCDLHDIDGIERLGIRYLFGDFLARLDVALSEDALNELQQNLHTVPEDRGIRLVEGQLILEVKGFSVELDGTLVERLAAYFDRLLQEMPSEETIRAFPSDWSAIRRASEANLRLSIMVNSGLRALNDSYVERTINLETKDQVLDRFQRLINYGSYKHFWIEALFAHQRTIEAIDAKTNLQRLVENSSKGLLEQDDIWLANTHATIRVIDSRINVVKSSFFLAIEGIDVRKLRSCEICGAFFWAKRATSKTCSSRCYNSLRQRRFRDKNSDELNARRRANYAYLKGRNEGLR